MVNTTKGPMDEALLEKREGAVDNDQEFTTWVEYWLFNEIDQKNELVHRSVHVRLKPLALHSEMGSF